MKAIRSPFHRAGFSFGDIAHWQVRHPGIVRVLKSCDIPGRNLHGVLPPFADQPVFAEGEARFKGEAVAAVVGERSAVERLDLADFPVTWEERTAVLTLDQAVAPGAPQLHASRANNTLVKGRVARGDADTALAACDAVVEGTFETGFVEHAYIEPEAGFGPPRGRQDRGHRVDAGDIYGPGRRGSGPRQYPTNHVRIIPSACGGGFGSKLDLSMQPFVALAAWLTNRPCRNGLHARRVRSPRPPSAILRASLRASAPAAMAG